MRRGQGSLEYLLILAAILAIAVVVVLIANMMLGTPKEANLINQDKYNFAVNGWEIKGYDKVFNPDDNNTWPHSFAGGGQDYAVSTAAPPDDATPIGTITDQSGNTHTVYTDDDNAYVDVGQDPKCPDEVCNGDETCDDSTGNVDICLDDCGTCVPLNTYYLDSDGDGYGNASVSTQAETQPSGYVTDNTDCNDGDATVWQERGGYPDTDHDGYGIGSEETLCTNGTLPTGYAAVNTDCNDSNATINPGATETCSNGIDDNCNGLIDCEDLDCSAESTCACGPGEILVDGACYVEITSCPFVVPYDDTKNYALGNDLTNCADGITIPSNHMNLNQKINCNGKKITGTGSGTGISLGKYNEGLGIYGCDISGFGTGLKISNQNQPVYINNNNIHDNTNYGIAVLTSAIAEFNNNRICASGLADVECNTNSQTGFGNIYTTGACTSIPQSGTC